MGVAMKLAGKFVRARALRFAAARLGFGRGGAGRAVLRGGVEAVGRGARARGGRSAVAARRGVRPVAPLVQGSLLVAAGLWPVVHLRSFEAVTGPKVDDWLVKTMGGVLAVIGGTLVVGALRGERSSTLRVLGVGSALTLALADLVYGGRGRISRVYLADGALQLALAAGWLVDRRA